MRKLRCLVDLIALRRSAGRPDRPHVKARRGLRLPRRAGGTWNQRTSPAMPDAQTSKKTLEALGTDVLTLLVVSVSTMLV
jgi:hypothetical protein